MPDPTPGVPTPTLNEEPRTGTLFQVLVTGERDPTAIYRLRFGKSNPWLAGASLRK